MAKSSKPAADKPAKPKTTKKTTAGKSAAAKGSTAAKGKSKKQPVPAAKPLIDTALAAEAAAAMVAHRNKLQQPAEQSGLVDQLKQQMSRNTTAPFGALGGSADAQKRSHLPQSGGRSLGNIHTSGGFNRTGVPRRTSG